LALFFITFRARSFFKLEMAMLPFTSSQFQFRIVLCGFIGHLSQQTVLFESRTWPDDKNTDCIAKEAIRPVVLLIQIELQFMRYYFLK